MLNLFKKSRNLVWRDKGILPEQRAVAEVPCLTTDVPNPGRSGPERLTVHCGVVLVQFILEIK